MSCKHEKIKSVNCEIFCLSCGEKLPIDYLVAKERIAAQKIAENPVAGVPAAIPAAENPAAVNGENSADNGDTPAEKPAKKERKPREVKGGKK